MQYGKALTYKWKNFRRWLCKKLVPDNDARMVLILKKAGYEQPPKYDIATVQTQCVVNKASYEFLHSADGECKYDAKYGLTRQLADLLKPYVKYTESYDEAYEEWTLKVMLKVVKE